VEAHHLAVSRGEADTAAEKDKGAGSSGNACSGKRQDGSVMDLDRAEAQLNRLIEDWAAAAQEAERAHAAWAESERRYNLRQAAERRLAWIGWHRRQAALFESLAAEHRAELGKLIDQGVRR